jgi:hypothetical protein
MNIQTFDYSVDILQVLLWQYNEAKGIKSILVSKQLWYLTNQEEFWLNWFAAVFNLGNANVFGLSVWAIILDIPLFLDPGGESSLAPIFGFNEIPSINSYLNFENSNFSSRGTIVILTEEEQRLILRLRYFQLITRGAIPEINTFLNILFNSSAVPYQGNVWVLDNFDMTMTYVFDFDIPTRMLTILQKYDLLPRPAGVQVIVEVI